MSKNTKAKTFFFFSVIALLSICSGSTSINDSNQSQTTPSQVQNEDITKTPVAVPTCTQDTEVSRSCSGCSSATVTYTNKDCTTSKKEVSDSSCLIGCPIVQPVYNPPPVDTCCKHCTNSQPCGDSCISKSYTCHKGPGCACY